MKVLRWLVSLSLLVLLGLTVDVRGSLSALQEIRIVPFLLVIAGFPLLIYLSVRKWDLLLRSYAIHIPFAVQYKCYWVGFFFSNFMPTSIGGDAVRLMLVKARGEMALLFSSIFFERLTGFAALLLLSFCTLLWCGSSVIGRDYYLLLLPVVTGGLFLLVTLLLASARLSPWVAARELTVWPKVQPLVEKLRQLLVTIASWPAQKAELAVNLFYSIIFYLLRIGMHYLLIVALGMSVPVTHIAVVLLLIDLLQAVPVALNGLGLAEGAFVLLYGKAGIPPAAALMLALLWRGLHVAASSVGGLLWMSGRHAVSKEGCN